MSGLGAVSASKEPFDVKTRSVTNATEQYQDIREAVDDGFEIMGPYVPDMGFHLMNFERIEQAARRGINSRQPQGLTYNLERTRGSVEYIVPLDDDKPDVFNDDGETLPPVSPRAGIPTTAHSTCSRTGTDDKTTDRHSPSTSY